LISAPWLILLLVSDLVLLRRTCFSVEKEYADEPCLSREPCLLPQPGLFAYEGRSTM
jgi:hypothetical protein